MPSETAAPAGQPPRDPTLQHPRCVFQILKRHFSRYTPEVVSQVCGCTPEELVRVAELLCANSGRERTSTIVYALGWTQHTTGVQMIRTAGILQLLLGNVGRPGGGIMAMRGHSTIQGSTDLATLYDVPPRRPPTSRPKSSSSRPPPPRRRRGPSPTPSGCSSGTVRPSTRSATAAPTHGSSTTSASGSRGCTPARPTPGTSRC